MSKIEATKLFDRITSIKDLRYIQDLVIECLQTHGFKYNYSYRGKYNFRIHDYLNYFQISYECYKLKILHNIIIDFSMYDTPDSLKKKWRQFVRSINLLGKHKFI